MCPQATPTHKLSTDHKYNTRTRKHGRTTDEPKAPPSRQERTLAHTLGNALFACTEYLFCFIFFLVTSEGCLFSFFLCTWVVLLTRNNIYTSCYFAMAHPTCALCALYARYGVCVCARAIAGSKGEQQHTPLVRAATQSNKRCAGRRKYSDVPCFRYLLLGWVGCVHVRGRDSFIKPLPSFGLAGGEHTYHIYIPVHKRLCVPTAGLRQ